MKHKHAELMAQYAQDAMKTERPWELWEARAPRKHDWFVMSGNPLWRVDFEYRRKQKTNSQVACELLDTAYDALEAHSAIICEPNVDYIQSLILDVKELIQHTLEDKPVPTASRKFTCSVSEGVTAVSPDDAAWYLREVMAAGVTPVTVCDQWGNEYTKVGIRPTGEQA